MVCDLDENEDDYSSDGDEKDDESNDVNNERHDHTYACKPIIKELFVHIN